ncbi:MAG: hypothetical protein GC154_04350 [bacterium]|nr:hypothetical protein [bacterium]
MIDVASEVALHVGDEVCIDSLNGRRGAVEAIRVISEARLVEEYHGKPGNVVLTIQIGDAVVNKRGIDVTLPPALV